ncbi:hypothetical protein [Candidatus Nephthysia bennettiae]|uniref:hypothetical protein n=1 Tax=Candidatus Nephthysia bennettiae TaxID=3127016 RepID=UPI001A294D91|nr:hypothetical protein [Candidatus Dormibacteraeota bacterium]
MIVAAFFRKEIKGLLSKPMKHMKIGPFDAEWDRVVATTEARGDLTPPPLELSTRVDALGPGGLADLARLAPMEAVLRAYKRLEDELRQILEEKVGGPLRGGLGVQVLHAKGLGLIDDRNSDAIEGMTVLRNFAVHGREEVNVEKALDYIALVDAVIKAVRYRAFVHSETEEPLAKTSIGE